MNEYIYSSVASKEFVLPDNKMPIIIFDFLLCDVVITHEIISFVINIKGKLKDIVTSN